MADWQHHNVVQTNRGYHVSLPNHRADSNDYTAYLEDQDGPRQYLWVHEITMNFQISGTYAQSHKHRSWYPRNFVQPTVGITGQMANQESFGDFVLFVRECQHKSLRWDDSDNRMNTVHLHIPAGKLQGYQGHSLNGHIRNVQWRSERWVNAPQFSFEFIVAMASAGLYHTHSSDPSIMMDRLGRAMHTPMGQQVYDATRGSGHTVVNWGLDPDRVNERYNSGPT
jgi:hypothetical protein